MQAMTWRTLGLSLALVVSVSCRAPVINAEPALKAGGTIAGIVRSTEGAAPLPTRLVTATNVETGQAFRTTTGVNGGYTIKVAEEGHYRLEVELRPGEVIAKGPQETRINNGDLDPGRDFEITLRSSR